MYCNIVIPPDGNPANHTSVYNALKVFRVHLQSMGVIVRSVHREGYGRGLNVSLSGSIDFPQKIVKR